MFNLIFDEMQWLIGAMTTRITTLIRTKLFTSECLYCFTDTVLGLIQSHCRLSFCWIPLCLMSAYQSSEDHYVECHSAECYFALGHCIVCHFTRNCFTKNQSNYCNLTEFHSSCSILLDIMLMDGVKCYSAKCHPPDGILLDIILPNAIKISFSRHFHDYHFVNRYSAQRHSPECYFSECWM